MVSPPSVAEQIPRKPARFAQIAVALAALPALEALFAAMAYLGDLKLHVVGVIALALAAGIVYCIALYGLEHCGESPVAFWLILAGALLFRLTLLPLPPSLSTDLYRYRWEGQVQNAGWNPYLFAPVDPRFKALRDPGWAVMPVPEIPAVYPPLSEIVFKWAARSSARWAMARATRETAMIVPDAIGFKLPFFFADLLVVALLAWWLRSIGGRNYQLAVYAWSPLIIVEFAAGGHNDVIAIAALVLALSIIRRRPGLSTIVLTAGALTKLFPITLVPLGLRLAGWPRRWGAWMAAGCAAGLALLCAWPYRAAAGQLPVTFRLYRAIFQGYNASLYAVLLWLTHRPPIAAGIGEGVVACLVLWAAVRKVDPVRAAFLIVGAILMFAPNGYSWYFTWMVPLLCFFPEPAWLLLTILQFLSYNVLISYQITGAWRFDPYFQWLTYAPFYLLLLGTPLVRAWWKSRKEIAAIPAAESAG